MQTIEAGERTTIAVDEMTIDTCPLTDAGWRGDVLPFREDADEVRQLHRRACPTDLTWRIYAFE